MISLQTIRRTLETTVEHLLDGCRHAHYTFPRAIRSRQGFPNRQAHYVACLDCGAEFGYDWGQMRRGPRIPNLFYAPKQAPLESESQTLHSQRSTAPSAPRVGPENQLTSSRGR